MLTQAVAQGGMQKVGRRVVGADLGAAHAIDLQLGQVADFHRAGYELADM